MVLEVGSVDVDQIATAVSPRHVLSTELGSTPTKDQDTAKSSLPNCHGENTSDIED
jgi:hypothetical protein